VFDHYGGFEVFPRAWDEMMLAVDKPDSAQYSRDEILKPAGSTLLSFLMDARTGLGRLNSFRISNYHLVMELIDFCRHRTIADVLAHIDVVERLELLSQSEPQFVDQIRRCSKIYGDVIVLDLRQEKTIFPGHRFMIYAMHPQCTLSVHALWGLKQMNTVFAVGKSIINRSSLANIGELMLSYEGGGHENAGTCQVPNDEAASILEKILSQLNDAAKFSDNLANQPVSRAAG
jgi:nanoRNase/pAp phosphatase (c-di-AMP/oligoRNAs hydrolase)